MQWISLDFIEFHWISLDFIGFHILPTKIRAKKEKEIKMKKKIEKMKR